MFNALLPNRRAPHHARVEIGAVRPPHQLRLSMLPGPAGPVVAPCPGLRIHVITWAQSALGTGVRICAAIEQMRRKLIVIAADR